jgi:hypothetical protein
MKIQTRILWFALLAILSVSTLRADESHYLVNLINSFHPGRATYIELPGMGHDFYKYDSELKFLTRRNNPTKQHAFDDELTSAIMKWLNERLQA